jgi:hypothetical protein
MRGVVRIQGQGPFRTLVAMLLFAAACGGDGDSGSTAGRDTAATVATDSGATGMQDTAMVAGSIDAPNFAVAGLDRAGVALFVDSLKAAVGREDRAAVAALVDYPLSTTLDGGAVTIANADEFVSRYDALVNERVRAAILDADVDRLFVNYRGVRIGRGEAWFGGVYAAGSNDLRIRIIAFNPDMTGAGD